MFISEQVESVVIVPTGFEAFSVDAALGSLVLFGQIEGDAVEHGKCCAAWPERLRPIGDRRSPPKLSLSGIVEKKDGSIA